MAGVKGMKWGVRKRDSVKKGRPMPKLSKFDKAPPKNVKKMSDQELKKVLERLRNEKAYKDLTKPEITEAQKFIRDQLTGVAKQQTSLLLNQAANAGIKAGLGLVAKEMAQLAPYLKK